MTPRRVLHVVVALFLTGSAACSSKGTSDQTGSTAGRTVGDIHAKFSIPGGITLESLDYTINGPTSTSGVVDLSHSANSVEFVVGGLTAGSGYTLAMSGADTNGDPCVSQPTPFTVGVMETTMVDLTVVCTIGGGSYVIADAGTGSVQASATVVEVQNPTTTCPIIASYGAANVEFQPGTSTDIAVTTNPPNAAISFSMTTVGDAGAAVVGTVTATKTGATFACVNPGRVQLTVTTSAPLALDAGQCPNQSQSIWIHCEDLVCPANLTACRSVCVDTTSDANNCGACGTTCQAGATCVNGACTLVCPAGMTSCGSDCVNLQTNPNDCGACGNVCPSGQTCAAGACSPTTCVDGTMPNPTGIPVYIDVSSGIPVVSSPSSWFWSTSPYDLLHLSVTQVADGEWEIDFGFALEFSGCASGNRGFELISPATGDLILSYGIDSFSYNNYYQEAEVYSRLWVLNSSGQLAGRTPRISNAVVPQMCLVPQTFQLAVPGIVNGGVDVYIRAQY